MPRLTLLLSVLFSFCGQAAAEKDPYLWLESIESKKALEWVDKQNQQTTARWGQGDSFERLRSKLESIYSSQQRLPDSRLAGEYFYNYWREDDHSRGIWRRTTKAEYATANPKWETVLDLDHLSSIEKEDWSFSRAVFFEVDHSRCLVLLSRGGSDAVVLREFDLQTKAFVEDGFSLPESKMTVKWAGADTLIVGADFGRGSLTTSGYPRVLKRWQRGQPITAAPTIFKAKKSDVTVGVWTDLTSPRKREIVFRSKNRYSAEVFLIEDGKLVPVNTPEDAVLRLHNGRVLIRTASPWRYGDSTYKAGSLLVAGAEEFISGKAKLSVLYEPVDGSSLFEFVATQNHVLLNELVNVKNVVSIASKDANGEWKVRRLTKSNEFRSIQVHAVDGRNSDQYALRLTDYLTPDTLEVRTVGSDKIDYSKSAGPQFDATGLVISQHWATSKDGTRVPYFQVGPKNPSKLATVMYGYGGFQVSQLPLYLPHIGGAWLEQGGVFVVANIRGGGEFGPAWHQAALQEKRPRSYEDFIAIAEDLIERGVTTKQQLGALGASNGGLLVANAMTMRPDLFRAIICQMPLLDMRRYHLLPPGASWIAEYGNPDKRSDWAFMKNFSPYHNIKKQETYPNALFVSSRRDDRAHPAHARKMVEKMNRLGHQVNYFESVSGGHLSTVSNHQAAYRSAIGFTYFSRRLNLAEKTTSE